MTQSRWPLDPRQYDFLAQPPDSTYERQENIRTPAMDATTAETPTLDYLLSMLNEFATDVDEMEADGEWEEAEKGKLKAGVRWLASHLPALMADKARMDWMQEHPRLRVHAPTPTFAYWTVHGCTDKKTLREALDDAMPRLAQGERTR